MQGQGTTGCRDGDSVGCRDRGRCGTQGHKDGGCDTGSGAAGTGAHLYKLRPPMVTRLEKTLKLCMCLGQDWIFRYPGGGRGDAVGVRVALGGGPGAPHSPRSPVISRTVRNTFSFSGSSAEMLRQGSLRSRDRQSGTGGPKPQPPTPPTPRPPRPPPLQAGDEEIQVAQDLGAVHEGVDVAGVHGLVLAAGAGALAGCGTGRRR